MTEAEILKLIQRENHTLINRINNMVRFGKTILLTDGKTQSYQIKVANEELVENTKYIENYGITSKAPKGSETIAFAIQGNAGNIVLLNIGNRQLRFKDLKDGEVAMYDNSGNYIHMKNSGKMKVKAPEEVEVETKAVLVKASAKVVVQAPEVTVDSQLINLGGPGGQQVARLGDTVEVDPITHKGTITSAATSTKAV